ncbi:DUF3842 family protein [Clostridium lundense]|uniref:DUF3842 family protein n=1 Tax=Clostridium lundense TaxID=319475 RepID=UPI00047F87F7|nr:DUF3842 family protein [Clostridium lundense]
MNIVVIDGQGAGLGQTIVKKLRKELGKSIFIIALGTNIAAANNMIKAGANKSIIGEKDIHSFLKEEEINCIIGPIGILCNGGINGEITSKVCGTIFEINCTKYIIPLQKHGIYIPGTRDLQIKEIIEEIISDIKKNIKNVRLDA